MFSGLKNRVNSVLQEGRQLSENLSNAYMTTNNSHANAQTHSGRSINAAASSAAALVRDLGSSIASSVSLSTKPVHDSKSNFPYDILNKHAGCIYLAEQERVWHDLHRDHASNASIAEQIDADILDIRASTERNLVNFSDMKHSLQCLPAIQAQMSECKLKLADIAADCHRIEEALFQLEDITEELELQERILQMNLDLAKYRDSKMADLEKVRTELVNEYTQQQRQHVTRLRSVQLERQAVFAEAFQKDLNCYRTTGTIPKIDRVARSVDPGTLEEIVLDAEVADTRTLDEFLNN